MELCFRTPCVVWVRRQANVGGIPMYAHQTFTCCNVFTILKIKMINIDAQKQNLDIFHSPLEQSESDENYSYSALIARTRTRTSFTC